MAIRQLIENAARQFLHELTREEAAWLLSPARHMPLLAVRRAETILSRVRLIAALFALLTAGWIPIDALVLPWPLWGWLALGRLAASAGLALLAVYAPGQTRPREALLALAGLFAIPMLFYVFSYALLAEPLAGGLATVLRSLYAFLPFVVVAGLSIFPLTAIEGAAFAAPVLAAETLAPLFGLEALRLGTAVGEFWMLLLIASVATLAGMSQLGFMIALMRHSIRDPLTGAFSRRSGEELLALQSLIADRSGAPLALAFLDLDDFKTINDRYGHEAGDRVLAGVAARIQRNLRAGDMLVRWGGEEFLLVLPNTRREVAKRLFAERLRQTDLGQRPDGRPVTASVGLAERLRDGREDWRMLVALADRRMYLAKKAGKSRVVARGG